MTKLKTLQLSYKFTQVYRYDKKQENCPGTYNDILIKQSHGIVFPTKGVEVTNKLLLTKLYQYEINFD